MPKKLTSSSKKALRPYPGSWVHPYATHATGRPEHVPSHLTMSQQGDSPPVGDEQGGKRRRRRSRRNKNKQQEIEESTEVSNLEALLAPLQVQESLPEIPSLQPPENTVASASEPTAPSTADHQPEQTRSELASALLAQLHGKSGRKPRHSKLRRIEAQMGLLAGAPSQQGDFAQAGQSRQFSTMAPNRPSPSNYPQRVYEELQKLSLSSAGSQSHLQTPAGQVREQHWLGRGRKKNQNQNQNQNGQNQPGRAGSPTVFSTTSDKPNTKRRSPRFNERTQSREPTKAERTLDDVTFKESTGGRSTRRRGVKQDKEIKLPPPPPSPSYLELASEPTTLVANPAQRQLLVILDLNGTLFYRERLRNGLKDKNTPYARPGLSSFFEYLFREHHVVFFSSAMQATVLQLLQSILKPEYRSKVARIFTREDMGIPEEYYHSKVSTFKRLTMVWRSLQLHHHSWSFSQRDTILLDDSPDKASTEPHNHLEVPEYNAELHAGGGDWVLRRAAGYIEEARKWDNVSSYVRSNPFDAEKEYEPPVGWEDYKSDLPAPVRMVSRVAPEETARFHERYQQDVARGVARPYSIRGLIAEHRNL